MSSQRGNIQRSRAQSHQNSKAFKNDLHDKTPMQKYINSINVTNVCMKCKHILEWKIKYKKYKPLKSQKKCTKCDQKSIKHAYHIMCTPCANSLNVCAKCGKNEDIVDNSMLVENQLAMNKEIQQIIKMLPERKRRTFLRYLAKNQLNLENASSESLESQTNQEALRDMLESFKACSLNDAFDDDFDDCGNPDENISEGSA